MPTPDNVAVRMLRIKYTVAAAAHASCIEALGAARRRGEQPPEPLLEQARNALRAVTEARAELLEAMLKNPGG
jgi:hypothetical protein